MFRLVLLIFGLASLLETAESARILVFFCQAAKSHHIVFQPLIRELAVRGHEVDYYTHHLMEDPPPNLHQIHFPDVEELLKKVLTIPVLNPHETSYFSFMKFVRTFKFEELLACRNYPEVQQLFLSDKKYDVVIAEFFFVMEDWSVLMHKFNALGVAISPYADMVWTNDMSGLPNNPSYMMEFNANTTDKMTFSERLESAYVQFLSWAINTYYVITGYNDYANTHYRYKGWEGRPNVYDISRDVALVLINAHHSCGYSYPRAPHVKEVLGMNVEENPIPLPKDLQTFMDGAEHGVIYFTMGSFADVAVLKLTGAYDVLMGALKNRKERVLWKWTSAAGDAIPSPLPENMKMMKWFPQQSVLAHNKTKLFLTHCGLGGLVESVNHGVPMVGIPLANDQLKNAKFMNGTGLGIMLDLFHLTEENLSRALDKVLSDPSYKAEAARRQKLFKDRPMKPVQEAVYWIEYIIKHGKVLQPASAHLPFYQLYLLDVFGVILVCLLLAVFVIKKTCQTLFAVAKKTLNPPSKESMKRSEKKKRQ